jgi:hypothetical protein
MHYLPKKYPAFLKLLLAIADHGNKYEGTEATPLDLLDSARIDQVIGEVREWLRNNKPLLQKVGLMAPGHVVYFDFDTPKNVAK